MNAFGIGVVAAACVGALVAAAGSIPQVVARWRTRRRLAAASRPGVLESTLGRAGGDATMSLGAAGRWSGRMLDRVRGSNLVIRWWEQGGGRRRRADRSISFLLESVARELRSGASLQGALLVATRGPDLEFTLADPATSALATSLARGVPVGDAITAWVGDEPTPSRHLAGTALIVAAQTGGASALAVDGVADTLRDRVALEREVAALSSQARASALLLVVAPVVVAVLAASLDARIAAFLLGSPAGWACIVVGLLLDAAGATWIQLTIRRSS